MDIGSGYPPSPVNTPATGPEATGETVAVVVEAHKSSSEAITLDRIQISQYGDTFRSPKTGQFELILETLVLELGVKKQLTENGFMYVFYGEIIIIYRNCT